MPAPRHASAPERNIELGIPNTAQAVGDQNEGAYDRCVFVSHSSHDDQWATDLRRRLIDEIDSMPGYRALVDERRFEAGDLWRPILYQWLGIADAAVLLVSSQALSSAWVRKEATILMWRRDLGSGVRVIPVLLGVDMSDVAHHWPAIEIDESQAISVNEGTTASLVVQDVLARFVEMGTANDAVRGWTARVSSLLEKAADFYLRLGAAELGLNDNDLWLNGLHESMSHALLHSDILRAEKSLRQTADGLGEMLGPLVSLVTPVAIPLDVAEPVSRAMVREPGKRIAVVPVRYSETGQRVADRATCSDRRVIKVEALCVGIENSAEYIFSNIVESLSSCIGVPPNETLTEEDLAGLGPIVLTIKYSADDGVTIEVLRTIVARLSSKYPTVTVIVLAGANTPDVAARLDLPNAVVAPPLNYNDERIGYMAARRMLNLIQRRQ